MTLHIRWIDRGREPQCTPDPNFPQGKPIELTRQAKAAGIRFCRTELPYPAKRCGVYLVECSICGVTAGITTAGRPDDPTSVELPCRETRQ